MDRFDLLAVQGTLKSLIQHHSSTASILLCSAFFMVQLSHPYMTTGKTIALTRQTFVSRVMSLLFDMLSRLVITFLPNSNCLLISWLQSPSAVIWSPTLPWPNQTLLWTSVGLWSISLESLLIAAIISSYSCNLKPRYTSRSLHCNHQASSGMCTHTHTCRHSAYVREFHSSQGKTHILSFYGVWFYQLLKTVTVFAQLHLNYGLPRWH